MHAAHVKRRYCKREAMFTVSKMIMGAALLAMTASAQFALAGHDKASGLELIERGRYLARIAGCNDCHTPGYAQAGGKLAEKQWLVGDRLGWRGPWGTTYPSNLRLYMQSVSEEQWIRIAHTAQYRPPMPWFALRDMTTRDLRAIYRFIKHLGPAGEPAPAYLPPDQEPKGPFVLFP
jgi:mono/diheme cytochrome c family protein